MILLELRDHLLGRARQGALPDALAALGEPQELARAFVEAGAGDTYRQVGMPGRALVPVEPPPSFHTRRPLKTGEILTAVRATWAASRDGLILVGAVLVTTLTATNWLLWVDQLRPSQELASWPVMAVRVVALLLSLAAAYRIVLSEEERPWAIDVATLRFAGALIALLAVTFAGVGLAVAAVGKFAALAGAGGSAVIAVRLVTTLLALGFFSCAALRLQPWAAALAVDRRELTLKASWRGTSGRVSDLVRGWAVLVLPPYLLHFALTYAALRLVPFGPFHLMLAALDAAVSLAAVLGAVMLNATIYRWVLGDAAPEPRPFSTEPASEELVEQARLRLRRLIDASAGRASVR